MYALATILAMAVVMATTKGVAMAQCYQTTRSILEAQLADVNNEIREYVICPGTTLQVGPPTSRTLGRYLFDRYPLMITKPNITIKCGDNGSRHNNCLVTSSNKRAFYLAAAYAEMKEWGLKNVSISGSKLQGITFGGEQFHKNNQIALSSYMWLVASGHDFVIEDCAFANLISDLGILVGLASTTLFTPEMVPTGSISVIVRNSYFYYNQFWELLLQNDDQNLTVESCVFDNVTYVGPDPLGGPGNGVFVRSRYAANTLLKDSCIQNGIFAQSMVQNVYDNSAKFTEVPECTLRNVYGLGNVVLALPPNIAQYGFCPEGYQVGFKNLTGDGANTMLSCTTVNLTAPTCPATADTYVPCFTNHLFGARLC